MLLSAIALTRLQSRFVLILIKKSVTCCFSGDATSFPIVLKGTADNQKREMGGFCQDAQPNVKALQSAMAFSRLSLSTESLLSAFFDGLNGLYHRELVARLHKSI